MKEEKTDKIKYKEQAVEVQKLLGKKYSVSGISCRWFRVYKKSFFGLGCHLSAKIYALDDTGYGDIIVYDRNLYDALKKWGKQKGFPLIKSDWED